MSSMVESFVGEDSISISKHKVYRVRFYVLFVFCFLAFNQCLIWSTFSSIYESTEIYYNISESTVDLFLAYGPICFIPCLPLSYILLNKSNGLRYSVILLSIIELISTLIRVIPSMLISSSNVNFHSITLPFVHIGQILNAMCGPLAMVPVSQLSCLWFDKNERTRATTIAIMAYNLGSTLSFPLGPFVVSSPEDLPHLLYIHLGFSVVGFVLVLIYFPSQPPTPPSSAAELLMKHSANEGNIRSLMENIRRCFVTPSFVLLVTASGLIGGTFGVWTSLFDVILTPLNYNETQIGWIGFSSSVSEIIGGLCLSTIVDMPRFNHSFKIITLICFICYFLSIVWFNLSIKSILIDKPLIPSNIITIGISATLAGFFQGGGSPLTYESLAEIMYPLPESLSASILVQLINLTSLILYFIAPSRYKILNLTILIIIFGCIILCLLTRYTYKRRDYDQMKRRTTDIHLIENSFERIDTPIDLLQMDPIYPIEDQIPVLRLSNY